MELTCFDIPNGDVAVAQRCQTHTAGTDVEPVRVTQGWCLRCWILFPPRYFAQWIECGFRTIIAMCTTGWKWSCCSWGELLPIECRPSDGSYLEIYASHSYLGWWCVTVAVCDRCQLAENYHCMRFCELSHPRQPILLSNRLHECFVWYVTRSRCLLWTLAKRQLMTHQAWDSSTSRVEWWYVDMLVF